MLQKLKNPFLLSGLLLLSNAVWANGVPVIFAVTVFHIIVINSVVIIMETLLLRRFSKSEIRVVFMILANLASLSLAYLLTDSAIAAWFNSQWYGLAGKQKIERHVFLAGVAVFILLTILIEWVFYHLAQKTRGSWLRSLKYSAIINLATNIPIALFYLWNDLYYELGD